VQVLPHLFRHAENSEEGVRNMVAECLGTLSNLDPPKVIGALRSLNDHGRPNKPEPARGHALNLLSVLAAAPTDRFTKWTIATALKYCMSSSGGRSGPAAPQFLIQNPELLTQALVHALEINVDPDTVTSEDLDVQRATLLMVNAAAHHQPSTITPFLPQLVVPLIYKSIRLKLQRKVNLGPFTHTVRPLPRQLGKPRRA
jgi:cullin-associated NEDD8-dissociated protein 1